jgi:glucose-1-phosphate cytidylyltransferase
MVEIGGRPILWHIMKHYSHYGYNEFYIALGYLGDVIKSYFLDYNLLRGSLTVKLGSGDVTTYDTEREDWIVHLMETGLDTYTGGRVRRLKSWLSSGTFMVTYGDGVSNIDLDALLEFHRSHGRLATVTAVRPPARFGGLLFDGDEVTRFTEKPQIGEGWINGGYLVFEPEIFDYLHGDNASLEADALEDVARDGQLMAYLHDEFWQCMDTLRDVRLLERLWEAGDPAWRVWTGD